MGSPTNSTIKYSHILVKEKINRNIFYLHINIVTIILKFTINPLILIVNYYFQIDCRNSILLLYTVKRLTMRKKNNENFRKRIKLIFFTESFLFRGTDDQSFLYIKILFLLKVYAYRKLGRN